MRVKDQNWAFGYGQHSRGIDPLADEFKKLPFSDLGKIRVFNAPAEKLLTELINQFDVCLCLNVLDHCHDPGAVIQNMYQYLRTPGLVYLWTDIGHGDAIHDADMTAQDVRRMVEETGFAVDRMTIGVDPYDFATQDKPNQMRCGVAVLEGVTCVVIKASKRT